MLQSEGGERPARSAVNVTGRGYREPVEPWRPWDADDEEYAERLVVRSLIPDPLRPALRAWLRGELNNAGYGGQTSFALVNSLQSALRVTFGFFDGPVYTAALVGAIEERGDRFMIRVVDFCLADYTSDGNPWSPTPSRVEELQWHLDQNMSAVTTRLVEGKYRITRRLPEGIEEVAQQAIDAASATAGRHLSKAWQEARSLDRDTSAVMTEAIRAVEAAAGPVVIPNDLRPRLSKIVAALKDNSKWTIGLPRRDDGYPDQRQILIGMLEVLAFAETQRHSGDDPSGREAMTHVQLASTLVSWFSIGAIVKDE